jgi:hypothetical protein
MRRIMANIIEEKLTAYISYFLDIHRSFNEIDDVFGRLDGKVEHLIETYGGLGEEETYEEANAQLSQLRILFRGYTAFMKKFSTSLVVLRDDVDKEIEFGQAMLEAMEVGG